MMKNLNNIEVTYKEIKSDSKEEENKNRKATDKKNKFQKEQELKRIIKADEDYEAEAHRAFLAFTENL